MPMLRCRPLFLACAAVATGLVPPAASAAADTVATKRALVVAMANYKALPPLPQCPIAARNIAAALRGAGFEVREAFDVSNGELNGALASFAQQTAPQSTLFTYYCGYADIYNGRAFLVPVSAALDTPDRIMVEGVVAASFVNVLGRTNPLAAIAIVDVAPAPGKSELVTTASLTPAAPAAATVMLAVSQSTPGGPGNVLADWLRMPVMTLRGLLEGARDEWKGQLGTTLALTELPANDVYLRGDAAVLGARAAAAKAPDGGVADAERQMSDPERRRVQSRLQALGYYPGPIDGQFGAKTRDAIRKFQAANGLASTGYLGVPEATRLLFFESKPAAP